MRWQIAEYIFCDQQQTLTSENQSQQLEPMMVELLSYFCRNIDQIISKDQLIEQVWLGRIVSDNAVSKLITKLRKAFNDDARQPKFIATFPKKGYKFIASVKQLPVEQTNENSPVSIDLASPTNSDGAKAENNVEQTYSEPSVNTSILASKRHSFYFKVFVMLVLVVFVIGISLQNNRTAPTLLTHAKALTAESGSELFPAVSPDGTRVSYMSAKTDRMHLIIKHIDDERTIEVNHEEGVGVGPASWSFDGRLLVYLVATPQRCQYFIREINGLELGEAKLIHNCPAGSYGAIAFTHDNNRLIFTESEGGNSPYSLFEINLTTDKKTRLNQPELFLGGNSQFDMHPTENKLLISSPDKQQWEGFYSLDLETDELKLLFKQNAYICCGIWSHNGERVVLMGEHPAYQLLSYNLVGEDMKIIYSGSRQINRPTRHSNGKDYMFSSGQQNSNIYLYDYLKNINNVIADASVDDRLATFSAKTTTTTTNKTTDQPSIAYISLTTGNEEIWLTDITGKNRTKLTHFNDSRHYVDLQWSPNGKLLMALTLNEIHLIDTLTGKFRRLKLPQNEIRAVSFKDNHTIAFSRKSQKQWQVYYYQLDTDTLMPAEKKWRYVHFTQDEQNTLWLDQQNQLYWSHAQKKVKNEKLKQVDFLSGRIFNLKKREQNWFWFDSENNYSLMRYSELNEKTEPTILSHVFKFDVQGSQILYDKRLNSHKDIYQTMSASQ
ncbi:winged helix-turn-helix domain-containing protein [Colwelliaceae bacterium 6441]